MNAHARARTRNSYGRFSATPPRTCHEYSGLIERTDGGHQA